MKLLLVSALVCALAAVSSAAAVASSGKRVVCYFTSWTVYRPGNGKFDVANIDPSLCTHIMYAFVGLNEWDGSVNVLDDWEATGLHGIENLINLKSSGAKIFLSMGGWNEGSTKYSNVAADPARRTNLINSVLSFLKTHGFDGFDLDWEYPNQRGGKEEDVQNYVTLLSELSSALHANGYELSAAVAGAAPGIQTSFDIPGIFRYLDFVNVMAYDYHGAFDSYVGHVSPLYQSHLDQTIEQKEFNVYNGTEYWLANGADPAKINLGVVTYGRTFTLADPKNTSLYAPNRGGGIAGPYSRFEGVLGYNEICELHSSMPVVWDDEQKVPHRVEGDQWYGYENEQSLEIKVQYALSRNLGGIMVWSLDSDDFLGICGNGPYPLLRSINRALGRV